MKVKSEHDIQNEIRAAVSQYAVIFRINVGTGRTENGNYFTTGVPPGFSDLFGFRLNDGKAVFIEVKTPKGKISEKQRHFLTQMKKNGAIAGVVRSPEEAIKLILEDKDYGIY